MDLASILNKDLEGLALETKHLLSEPPIYIDLTAPDAITAIKALYHTYPAINTVDIREQAVESYFTRVHYGQLYQKSPTEIIQYKKEVLATHELGRQVAVYLPGEHTMVCYAPDVIHYGARTGSNLGLITPEEQAILRDTPIGFIGLSVGSAGVYVCAQLGMRTLYGADGDVIAPANLNRLRTPANRVGLAKAHVMHEQLVGLDPYGTYRFYNEMINEDNIDKILDGITILVEECDHPHTKDLARRWAQKHRVDLVSVTDLGHAYVMIHVEPYRSDPDNAQPFAGRQQQMGLSDAAWSAMEPGRKFAAILGLNNIPGDMLSAFVEMQQGKLASFPQVATTVTMGGSAIAEVVRKLALKQPVNQVCILSLAQQLNPHVETEHAAFNPLRLQLAQALQVPLE